MFYKQNEGIRFSAVCLYVFVTKWKLISSQGLIIYSPQLNVTRSIFFFLIERKRLPAAFLNKRDRRPSWSLLRVTGAPLFCSGSRGAPIFQLSRRWPSWRAEFWREQTQSPQGAKNSDPSPFFLSSEVKGACGVL